jgi:hypothetical protein
LSSLSSENPVAQRKRTINRKKGKGRGRRPLVGLLLTILLIVVAFYLLEQLREKVTLPPPAPEQASERSKLPPRPGTPAVQQRVTSALPAAPPARTRQKSTGPGSLAIIIDDMGSSVDEARTLLAIGQPVTFSIIPGLPKARAVAEAAQARGGEVMLHLPMQPKDYPQRRLEDNGLLLAASDAELNQRIDQYLREVPFAVGANNHMGSGFTESSEKMRTVLTALKGRGFFYVDSMTTARSVGYSLARQLGMEAATRNVFLDNVQEVRAIRDQLEKAAELARKKGSAIAIGHPHPATLQALAAAMPQLARDGITFVYASEVVR